MTARLSVGERVPDLGLRALNGEPFTLARYEGKRVLLFVWAAW